MKTTELKRKIYAALISNPKGVQTEKCLCAMCAMILKRPKREESPYKIMTSSFQELNSVV
jgi:hypothetical protein